MPAVGRFVLGALLLLLLAAEPAAADLDQAGRAAYTRGDYAAAERIFADAARRSPRDPVLRYHRAVALVALGRWFEAVAEYETALRLNPAPDVAEASREGLRRVRPLLRAAPPRRAQEETVVGLERAGGGWVASVVLNGRFRGRFLVDTGAAVTAISHQVAEELDIRPLRGLPAVRLQTAGGPVEALRTVIPALRVGDIEAVDTPAVILDFAGLDGVLGNTFLARYTITLDAERGLLVMRGR